MTGSMRIANGAGKTPRKTLHDVADELGTMWQQSNAIDAQKQAALQMKALASRGPDLPPVAQQALKQVRDAPRDALFGALTNKLEDVKRAAQAIVDQPAGPDVGAAPWQIAEAIHPSYERALGPKLAADFAALRSLPKVVPVLERLGRADLLEPVQERLTQAREGVAAFTKQFDALVLASERIPANALEMWITGARSAKTHPENTTTIGDVFPGIALLEVAPELAKLDLHDALMRCAAMLRDGEGDKLVQHKKFYTSDSERKVVKTTANVVEDVARKAASGAPPTAGIRGDMSHIVVGRNAERSGPLMDFIAVLDQALVQGPKSLVDPRYVERT